jgi:Tfp pilus assembly protein PilO
MKSIYGKYFKRVAFIWGGCFVVFFLAYMFMLAPQKSSKEELRKQLEEKKKRHDYAVKATEKETQDQLKKQIKQLRNRLKDFVVDFEDATNLTFDISQIANDKAVTSFSIETSKKSSGGDQASSDKYIFESRIDISFSAASFNQFAALLNALERHKPVIFVDRFAITRSDNDNSGRQVKMDLAVFVEKIQDS